MSETSSSNINIEVKRNEDGQYSFIILGVAGGDPECHQYSVQLASYIELFLTQFTHTMMSLAAAGISPNMMFNADIDKVQEEVIKSQATMDNVIHGMTGENGPHMTSEVPSSDEKESKE